MAYCNLTTDLRDVFPQIGDYLVSKILQGWSSVSGQANTYLLAGVGHVEVITDDGVQLTVKTSIALVQGSAGSYYYISDTNLLYVHAIDSDDLTISSAPRIESTVDWDAFKTRMQNDAMEEMDSYLNRVLPTPLMPRLIKTHSSNAYDSPIRLSCAFLTCRNIVRRLSPGNKFAHFLEIVAINPNPEEGEKLGLIDKILNGDIVLQESISAREVGKYNIHPKSSNTSTAYIWVLGTYRGLDYERWRLQIDTAGVPGTATYKLSYDTGANWDVELQETFNTDNNDRRISIGSGLEVVFYGTFGDGDYWDIELFPLTDVPDKTKISSSELIR